MDAALDQLQPSQMVPTELLREKIRNYSRQHREKLRANCSDSLRFGLGEIRMKVEHLENLNEKDVSGLASRLKRRKHATCEDMYRLSHAFLQDIENIRAFAKIPGAIQVLVKELTGTDAERQSSAVECLCNFSLGEAPVCEKVANMAGSYLVTYLDSTEEHLKRTSLWTLANMLANGGKVAQTLIQMELVPKLWGLYVDDSNSEVAEPNCDFREDAAICLQLITLPATKHLIRMEDLLFIKQNFCSKNPTCAGGEYHLQILFNCGIVNAEHQLQEQELLYLINYALNNACNCVELSSTDSRLRVLYAVRILANLLASQQLAYNLLLKQTSTIWHTNLANVLNKLFEFRVAALTREALWLVQNILALDKGGLGENGFMDNLRVYNDGLSATTVIVGDLNAEV